MKRYRVLKPYSWTEGPGKGTINAKPGEMAEVPAVVFVAAPSGTFELWPGEEGYAPQMPSEGATAAEEPAQSSSAAMPLPAASSHRKAKAEVFAPNRGRKPSPKHH